MSLYIIYRIFIYTCLISYLYMYCRVTKKWFPMLCHILSIQVCRSICFMKCKRTIKKVQLLQFNRGTLRGGAGAMGGGGTCQKESHTRCRECGTRVTSQLRFLSFLNCQTAASASPRFYIWDELLIKSLQTPGASSLHVPRGRGRLASPVRWRGLK